MTLLPTATSGDEKHRAANVAVLPIGSFEQHGTHLPLITDTVVACAIAERIAATYDLFLLPPVTISCSHEHSAWPGTVSISHTTLTAVITDVQASLRRSGIERLGTSDNRTLEERLTAARSTLRFQDRRIADLETRIADPASLT